MSSTLQGHNIWNDTIAANITLCGAPVIKRTSELVRFAKNITCKTSCGSYSYCGDSGVYTYVFANTCTACGGTG